MAPQETKPPRPGPDELRGEPIGRDALAAFAAALAAAGLPCDDVAMPDVRAFRFALGARFVGYGALEAHDDDVLLRSIVVETDARGQGFGRRIVGWLLARARGAGAHTC